MLMGLQGKKQPEGFDENGELDSEIASKMSKSKPETSIFVHDSRETIARKLDSAFCPPRAIEGNALIEYSRYIVFRKLRALKVERPEKYGGNVEFHSQEELERAYSDGNLHPADLKRSMATALDEIISPIREHFEKDPGARRLYEAVKASEPSP
jgi:tyrosyl-tRNA synthetase